MGFFRKRKVVDFKIEGRAVKTTPTGKAEMSESNRISSKNSREGQVTGTTVKKRSENFVRLF